MSIAAPEHTGAQHAPALGYVRPHDMDIERDQYHRTAAIPAVVVHIQAIGPVVRLELKRRDTGERIEAEMSRERYEELALMVGELVSVKPRNLRLFEGSVDTEENRDVAPVARGI